MTLRLSVTVDPPHSVLVYEKKKLKAVMRAAGGEVVAATRKLLKASVGSGRVYRGSGGSQYRPYKAGRFTASGPGQSPALETGTLLRSITSKPSKSGQSVRISSAFYGLFLEYGAKGGSGKKGGRNRRGGVSGSRVLEPRPFLSRALGEREGSISDRIRASIVDDIKFRRLK